MVPSKNTALKYFKVSSTCQEMDHPSTYQENVESYGRFFQESKYLTQESALGLTMNSGKPDFLQLMSTDNGKLLYNVSGISCLLSKHENREYLI